MKLSDSFEFLNTDCVNSLCIQCFDTYYSLNLFIKALSSKTDIKISLPIIRDHKATLKYNFVFTVIIEVLHQMAFNNGSGAAHTEESRETYHLTTFSNRKTNG